MGKGKFYLASRGYRARVAPRFFTYRAAKEEVRDVVDGLRMRAPGSSERALGARLDLVICIEPHGAWRNDRLKKTLVFDAQ